MLAERALEAALDLARSRGGELTLLRVSPQPIKNRHYLEELAQPLEVPVSCRYLEGSAEQEIRERSKDFELVVMSSHGHSGFDRMILGSVTEKVVRGAECPILVVLNHRIRPTEVQRILVPLDGSHLCLRAVPEALLLAKESGATLVLARVNEAPGLLRSRQQEADAMNEYLQQIVDDLGPGPRIECIHDFGSASRTLVKMIARHNIDLVMMTTHGRSGFDRVVAGSVAENVLRNSPVPVWLIPARS